MPIVAVTGDAATTTSVALTAAWPVSDDVLLVEADPSGGDLAAWFDLPATPSLSAVVARSIDGSWIEAERLTRLSKSGLRVLTAPPHVREAQYAVGATARGLVPALAAANSCVSIVDVGYLVGDPVGHPFVAAATTVLAVHRQAPQSPAAAAVRLQRFARHVEELVESTEPVGGRVVPVIVGAAPFSVGEAAALLAEGGPVVGLPIDPLSAAVLAGRRGVSERRLRRLPLMRAAAELARVVARAQSSEGDARWSVAS